MKEIDKHFKRIEDRLLKINRGKDTATKEKLYGEFFSRARIAYFADNEPIELSGSYT